MDSKELRQKYLDFFRSKGHAVISSASLIPDNDPTVLFTTAGMHPLVPYLMGEPHPEGRRLVSSQKCIRTGDIDEVGDATHLTFFEMLGNWSLGDAGATDGIGTGYFKKDAVAWSWEFLTSSEWLGLDPNKLAISIFEGDDDAPEDGYSRKLWIDAGIPEKRIAKLNKKENWWGPAGATGPCGPDTEMFYWTGTEPAPDNFQQTHDDPHWVEIWNDVFMEYEKTADGRYVAMRHKNVDTGMGLARTIAVLNGLSDVYETDIFINIIHKIEELSGKSYNNSSLPLEFIPLNAGKGEERRGSSLNSSPLSKGGDRGGSLDIKRMMRIVADHIKAATFIMGDDHGVAPSNVDQGYVVRRLIRRAIRYGKQLGIEQLGWTKQISELIIHQDGDYYDELLRNKDFILDEMDKEEKKFGETLDRGIVKIAKLLNGYSGDRKEFSLDATTLFNLYQTDGFPIELSFEEVDRLRIENGGLAIPLDLKNHFLNLFNEELKKHQELSRTASAGKFKGGLADAGEETVRLHTAAHLMLSALRKVLGEHVHQKGSNITAERLRFDFSHPEKMSEEQKKQVEDMVNDVIAKDLPVTMKEMTLDEAREFGVEGVFESKYGESVKVYRVGHEGETAFSNEICGGPHVTHTGEIGGKFRISKEESSSAGVRRIKAVIE